MTLPVRLIIHVEGPDRATMEDADETITAYLHNAIEDYNSTAGDKQIRLVGGHFKQMRTRKAKR